MRKYTIVLLCLASLLLVGCGPNLAPPKPENQFTAQELRGERIYAQACARCHYAYSGGDLHGPGLKGIFQKKYLQSGAPANEERVASVVLGGRNMMTPTQLDDQQMADLLAFLHTL
jgi:mono/diheme cytochrome c family protein